MSNLAYFFVSTVEEAKTFDSLNSPDDDVVESGGILPRHLEILWALFLGREWGDTISDEFEHIGGLADGSTWVVRFPSGFVDRLAGASPEELSSTRVAWAETEELAENPANLIDLMADLQKLAKNAESSGRSMFLAGSLN